MLFFPFIFPISVGAAPGFAIPIVIGVIVMYYVIVGIFNEVHLRLRGQRVATKVVYLYFPAYKLCMRVLNVISIVSQNLEKPDLLVSLRKLCSMLVFSIMHDITAFGIRRWWMTCGFWNQFPISWRRRWKTMHRSSTPLIQFRLVFKYQAPWSPGFHDRHCAIARTSPGELHRLANGYYRPHPYQRSVCASVYCCCAVLCMVTYKLYQENQELCSRP